jgi:glyoxylase I family protein
VLAATTSGASAALSAPSEVRIRYIENDVAAAVAFYTRDLGFHLDQQNGANFAMLSRGGLQLVLSPVSGPGSASQPMPDGRRPAPGGWNRMILRTSDLTADVTRLRKAGAHLRNQIAKGPGGSQVLVDDPSGNPVELFQPAGG